MKLYIEQKYDNICVLLQLFSIQKPRNIIAQNTLEFFKYTISTLIIN